MVNIDKIKSLAKSKGISVTFICSQFGVGRGYLNDVAKGKNKMSADRIRQIAGILDTTYEYLTDQTDDPEQPQDRQTRRPGVRIPVYGEVAAGVPILAIENYDSDDPDDWEEIDEHMARGGDYIALRIHGASMEPRMRSGDIVIVRLQPDVESDEIAIVCVNGENATCKKIKKSPDGITLISLNPAFDPVFYSKREIASLPITILGKVVELRAKF